MFSEKAEEILLCLLNMSSFSLAQRFVGCQNQGTRNRQQRSRAGRTWAWSPSGCITAAWAELSRHTSSDPGSRDRGGHELMGSTSADTLPTWSWSRWGRFETPLLEARSYKELSNCTRHVVQQLDCFWPNAEVDKFFLVVHQRYFRNCPVSGRALQDPPSSVLCPFIVVPILVTLLVTVLVVWRSKRPEGIV
ncbi:receptor activity-modifying protein 1 isoform X1 [Bubalus kerabau]|uniref:receptor activity-modifying protein 1 isoform X1 n=1 Tax=Bubalus carabanensis TaxID=3119969 RepID=UPI00244EF86C|nr:receptor activity-modifying protein 1 isoform X1 [Bubalus carabanensis]